MGPRDTAGGEPRPEDWRPQANALRRSSSRTHQFRQVEEQEAGANDDEAFISFSVTSRPNAPGSQGKPADTQRERSHFVREEGRWLYLDYK